MHSLQFSSGRQARNILSLQRKGKLRKKKGERGKKRKWKQPAPTRDNYTTHHTTVIIIASSFQMAQTRVKSLTAPVFEARSAPVPQRFWKTLMVRSEGAAVSSMLEEWGAPDLASTPAATLLVSARETTGRITSSKLVTRGPVFVAGRDNPFKANRIWSDLGDDVTIRFTIPGEALNFSNREARNFSLWAELTSLPSFKIFKAGNQLSPEESQAIMGRGACFRVSLLTYSVTHMEAVLLIAPVPLTDIRDKANTWDVAEESNVFPGIDVTNHWTR